MALQLGQISLRDVRQWQCIQVTSCWMMSIDDSALTARSCSVIAVYGIALRSDPAKQVHTPSTCFHWCVDLRVLLQDPGCRGISAADEPRHTHSADGAAALGTGEPGRGV